MNTIKNPYIYLLFIIVILNSSNLISDDNIDNLKSKVGTSIEDVIENSILNSVENIEIDLSGFNKGKPEIGLSTIVPLLENSNSGLFFQGYLSTKNDKEKINLGFAKRNLMHDNKMVLGYNTFYDHDFSSDHRRWGLGVDILTSLGDVHVNMYEAISDGVLNSQGNKEYVLDGYDYKLGLPIPFFPTSKIYAEAFRWNATRGVKDQKGEKFSVDTKLPYGMNLSFGKTFYSALAQDQEFIKFSINLMELKQSKKTPKNAFKSLFSTDAYLANFDDVSDRKFNKVRRENDIIIQTLTPIGITVTIKGYAT